MGGEGSHRFMDGIITKWKQNFNSGFQCGIEKIWRNKSNNSRQIFSVTQNFQATPIIIILNDSDIINWASVSFFRPVLTQNSQAIVNGYNNDVILRQNVSTIYASCSDAIRSPMDIDQDRIQTTPFFVRLSRFLLVSKHEITRSYFADKRSS